MADPMTPPNRPESAQPPAPDFLNAHQALGILYAHTEPGYSSAAERIQGVLSQAESHLSLLEAQNAELRASREADQPTVRGNVRIEFPEDYPEMVWFYVPERPTAFVAMTRRQFTMLFGAP